MRILKLSILFLILGCYSAVAGELDTYYLQQFGELPTVAKYALENTQSQQAKKCGMPLKRSLRKDWQILEQSTQKTLAKYLALPVTTGMTSLTSPSGNFIIWYFLTGPDAPTPVAPFSISGWAQEVAVTFDHVYDQEVTLMGYSPPTTRPYPVFLKQLANQGFFGVTETDVLTGQSATSFITIDNDFFDFIYRPYSGVLALQITAAHEFHHAIQFNYNFFFESWYAEATSTWMEDEVYDSVNQSYGYLSTYLSNTAASLNSGDGYDRWIFNRYLVERFGVPSIRSIWERIQATQSIQGSDVPTLPVIDAWLRSSGSSLSSELVFFAERLYTKEWTSHTNDIPLIYTTPLTINANYNSYPVNSSTLPAPSVTLPANSFAYFKFTPNPSSLTDLQITVAKTAGIQLALLKKTGATFSEIPVNADGTSFTVSGFGSMSTSDEVVLVIANTTSTNNLSANFSTDGATTPPPAASGGGGGGGGCFIATAAYGSYLHPEVMTLRDFRDKHLLTNLPGRAFVAFYYRLSPPIADFIRAHESARFIVRVLLAPVIFVVKHLWATLATAAILAGIVFLKNRKRFALRIATDH